MRFRKGILLLALCFLFGSFAGCTGQGDDGETGTTVAETEVFEKVDFGLNEPAATIDLVDFVSANNTGPTMVSAMVLQGIVNKKQPRIYIARPWSSNGVDVEAVRQNILTEYGEVTLNRMVLDSEPGHADGQVFWTLFEKYHGEVERLFVFPTNDALNDVINVAVMLAGRNQGIAVTSDLADQIIAEGYDLPRVDVLEYMGMTAQQANYLSVNNWIADNLVEGANKTIVYAAVPRERGTGEEFLPTYYDLIVASDGLVYNAGYDFLEAGKAYQKKILDQFPDCTPVMGWADLSMEEDYVSSVSECGKIIAGADWGYDNGSVWGAFPEYTHEEPINGEIPADYTAENGKMYVSFMMSDGDAWHFTDGSNIANFMNEDRGTFPMGWSTASLFGSCNPLIMEWYYDKKSPNDEFLQGPCGISYAYASKMPARSYENFLKLTKETFGKMGITMANYWDLVDNGGGTGNSLVGSDYSLIEKYVEIVQPDLLSRGHNSLTGEWQLIGDTVVIEQIGNYWAKNGVESYGGCDNASDIVGSLEYFREHELKSDAPLFIMVNVNSWGVGVQMVPEAINELKAGENADSYEFVLPSQMVAAIRNYSK